MQGPSIFLTDLDITIYDYFDAGKEAVVEADHAHRVNFENYYFADSADRDKFAADPLAYVNTLTDPVTKQRFKPGSNPPVTEFNGVSYYFSAVSSKEAFDSAPDYYWLPNYKMEEDSGLPPGHSAHDGHNH